MENVYWEGIKNFMSGLLMPLQWKNWPVLLMILIAVVVGSYFEIKNNWIGKKIKKKRKESQVI